MKKILFALTILISILVRPYQTVAQTPVSKGCLEADIVIVVDWSGSTRRNHEFMIDAIYDYSRSFSLSNDGIKIGIISFGDATRNEANLTSDTMEIDNGLAGLYMDTFNHSTYADNVAHVIRYMMLTSEKERGHAPNKRFVIFVSDGELDGDRGSVVTSMKNVSNVLQINVFSIYVGGYPDEENIGWQFMKEISTSPRLLFRSTYQELREFLKALNLCV